MLRVLLSIAALGSTVAVLHAQPDPSRPPPTVTTTRQQPRSQRPWRVGPSPQLVIGAEGAEREPFDNIRGVVRQSNGQIVVANMGASALQFFAPDGRFAKSAGRQGAGPGEFQQLFALDLGPADSLMAYDVVQGFHVYDPAGRYVRTIKYSRDPRTPARVWPVGWFASGSLVAARPPRRDGAAGRWVDSMTFYHADSNGNLGPWLFRYPSFEFAGGGRFGPALVAFGPSLSAAVWPQRYCIGFSARYEIACGAPGSAPTLLIRHRATPVEVSPSSIARFKEITRALPMEGGGPVPEKLKAQREALLESTVFAARQPYFARFLPADDGALWVERYQIEEGMPRSDFRQDILSGPTTWDVFNPSGAWLATVVLPARFRPFQIGADFVLGVRLDPDDVEEVVLFALQH